MTSCTISNKRCTPCQGGVDPLTKKEAQKFLEGNTPEWHLIDNATKIKREFEFRNFVDALAFVNKAGEVSEEENHHPDIELGWGYVIIKIQTHKINGLHENDFILATKIDSI